MLGYIHERDETPLCTLPSTSSFIHRWERKERERTKGIGRDENFIHDLVALPTTTRWSWVDSQELLFFP